MQELYDFVNKAVYIYPCAVQKPCAYHSQEWRPVILCKCHDALRYSIDYHRFENRCVYFTMSYFDGKWLPLSQDTFQFQEHNMEVLCCKACFQQQPMQDFLSFLDAINGKSVKQNFRRILSGFVFMPREILQIMDDYLHVGKKVDITCWECVELNRKSVLLISRNA